MLVKWGSIIVKGSGKLGGHVFSSGPNGASVHTLARARNPQTIYQTAIRSRFTELTQGWRDLSESQRETWYQAETDFSKVNRFGDVVFLSGKNLYESLNSNRQSIGEPIMSTAPLPQPIPINQISRVRILSGSNEIEIVADYAVNTQYVILATPALSQGTRFSNNSIRELGRFSSNGVGTGIFNEGGMYSRYVGKFGEPSSVGKIFIGSYSVSKAGQKSMNSILKAEYV